MERKSEIVKKAKTSPFKGKVLTNLLQESSKNEKLNKSKEAKLKRQAEFKSKYDKLRHWQPSKTANMNTFCSFPKVLFSIRGNFTLPALAVYPVLCADADYKNESFNQLSLEIIKKKTGLSINTVQKGLNDLATNEYLIDDNETCIRLLQRHKHTEGQRTYWLYKPWFIRENKIGEFKGEQFFFYTYLIESGIWRNLVPRAKALYLAMRSVAVFNFLEYCDAEDITYGDPEVSGDVYKNRKWEVCRTPIIQLCGMLGIDGSDIYKVIKLLIRYKLVEEIPDGYIVFFLPSDI